ncbi:hypothetical protein C7999DRAFT_15431, partial [Corynascus novoguineensis]
AMDYVFEPMPRQDRQRHYRIKRLLAERLSHWCSALPAELRLMVARHLVRLCAIVTTQALWATRESFDCSVDMSKDVWASYVHIDGIRYLAGLSNDRERAGSEPSKLVRAGNGFHSNTLYILEDH